MRTAIGLLAGWLLAALLLLGMDGRLPVFLAWVLPGSLLVLGVGSLRPAELAGALSGGRRPAPAAG
jgi:hypothetical protein